MLPRKVLVVEDSKLVQMMYGLMLSKCTVVHATDGLDGMAKLREHRDVDVIVLDLQLPRMDGLEFLKVVKADPVFARIPVVVVTTDGKNDTSERAVRAGAAAFLTKPFRSDAILDVLARLTASSP
jgi:two-component system, chemotaxis family, chemotaxis protein CheY